VQATVRHNALSPFGLAGATPAFYPGEDRERPMTTFDDREKAAESKFARDAETDFKVVARRNKLLGLWAAEKMGLSGEAADAYAKEVVMADFQEAGDDDVFRKVKADLAAKGADVSDHAIQREMAELLETARAQLAG
jgi:hypothetical protein